MTHRSGFSLIELLVVIAVIAIWAGIAIPRVANSLSYHRAEAAARRIVRDLELARRQARISSAALSVTFDPSSDSYELAGLQDMDHADEPYEVFLAQGPYRATIVSADFDGDEEIVFDGYGVPDSSGSVVIDVGGYQKTVTLDADTGRGKVQ